MDERNVIQDRTARLPLTAQFLLLAYGNQDGSSLLGMQRLKAALAGTAIVELTLTGALDLDESGRRARLRSTGALVEPSLREAVARSNGQTPKNAVVRLGGGQSFKDRGGELRDATFELLEAQGYGRLERDDILGLIPRRRWHSRSPEMREQLLVPMRAVVSGLPDDADTDRRVQALIGICHATGVLPKLFPDLDRRRLVRRGKEIMKGDWAGTAVLKALQEMEAAPAAAFSG